MAALILAKSGRKVPGVSGTRTACRRPARCWARSCRSRGSSTITSSRVHDGQDGGDDGLRGPGGDGDFCAGVVGAAVQRLDLACHGFAQCGHAGHGRVLVVAGLHGLGDGVHQFRGAFKVWKALPQVDGVVLGGQGGHHGEDGGAHVGQLAGKGGRAGGSVALVMVGRVQVRSRSHGRSWRGRSVHGSGGR